MFLNNSPPNAFYKKNQNLQTPIIRIIAGSEKIIKDEVDKIFNTQFNITNSQEIPDSNRIPLSNNSGNKINLAMLFVDIRDSTTLTSSMMNEDIAPMYKAFFTGVSIIVKGNNGKICSYNGDGILCAFDGENKISNVVRCALNINWFMLKILKPHMDSLIGNPDFFSWNIGADAGDVFIVKAGIKNDNDFIWVGDATNCAVKLSSGMNTKSICLSYNICKQKIDSDLANNTIKWLPINGGLGTNGYLPY